MSAHRKSWIKLQYITAVHNVCLLLRLLHSEQNSSIFNPAETALTAQKMKFSIKDFFCKYDQIRSFLLIWSHLLKKSLMENFVLCEVAS